MDTLYKLAGYEELMSTDSKVSSKTPQPRRKFSEEVEKKIEPMKNKELYFIGICGGKSCGKSTIAEYLAKSLKDCIIIKEENFFCNDYNTKKSKNYSTEQYLILSIESEYPTKRKRQIFNQNNPDFYNWKKLEETMIKLKKRETVKVDKYDEDNDELISDYYIMEPKKIVILEGMFIFKYPEIRNQLNLMIFVECDSDVRLGRLLLTENRILKDNVQSFFEFFILYEKVMKKSFEKHVELNKKYSDLILPNYEVLSSENDILKLYSSSVEFLIYKLKHGI